MLTQEHAKRMKVSLVLGVVLGLALVVYVNANWMVITAPSVDVWFRPCGDYIIGTLHQVFKFGHNFF